MVRGLDDETCIEFSTRTFEIKSGGRGKKISIETKADYKGRGHPSPDYSDAASMASELLARRGIIPRFEQTEATTRHRDTWTDLVKQFDIDSNPGNYSDY